MLEQTGSEAFQIAWKALSQNQQEKIGASVESATLYCQVHPSDITSTQQYWLTALNFRRPSCRHYLQKERVITGSTAGDRGAEGGRPRISHQCLAPGFTREVSGVLDECLAE